MMLMPLVGGTPLPVPKMLRQRQSAASGATAPAASVAAEAVAAQVVGDARSGRSALA